MTAVACPLFSAFGPEPVATRLALGEASVLVVTESLYRRKLEKLRERLPKLRHVLVVADPGEDCRAPPGSVDLAQLTERASEQHAIAVTRPEDMALLHFTSGTTGTPKGAVHVHEAAVAHMATGTYALDLRANDIY